MSTAPARRIDDYEIITELYSGGMGSVDLARKHGAHGFEKLVAIKKVRSDMRTRPEIRALFMNEARLVARLRHPSIAQVHDFGEVDGDAYLVMEYVAGVSFASLAKLSGGRLPIGPLCLAMAEVCRGLHAAHELRDLSGAPLQVVHRDISPDNLMLTFDGGVKILDFGIARSRMREAPVTAVGDVRGKPGYMAPEQLGAGDIDRRTDIFLAGIVLHELLTGERLFKGDSFLALAHLLTTQPITPPSRPRPEVDPALDALVMTSLARDSRKRFATAQQMAEALDAAAVTAGSESLETFAARVLAAERESHDERLRHLLRGEAAPKGRASNVGTLTSGMLPRPTRLRRLLVLGVAAVVAGGGALASWNMRRERSILAQTQASAPVEQAAPVAPTPEHRSDPLVLVEPVVVDLPHGGAPARTKSRHVRDKEPRAPTVAGTAFLTVGAEPYAVVRINGHDIGPTPIFERRVPAGAVEIELVTPDTRQVRLQRRLDLADGEHRQITAPPHTP